MVPLLVMQIGPRQRALVIDRPTVIGRAPECDVQLSSHLVSRRHARLDWRHGAVWVEDLASRNGTLINGQPLQGVRRLGAGDKLQIADVPMVLRLRSDVPVGHDPQPGQGNLEGMIVFRCPTCHDQLAAESAMVRFVRICPHCDQAVIVPGLPVELAASTEEGGAAPPYVVEPGSYQEPKDDAAAALPPGSGASPASRAVATADVGPRDVAASAPRHEAAEAVGVVSAEAAWCEVVEAPGPAVCVDGPAAPWALASPAVEAGREVARDRPVGEVRSVMSPDAAQVVAGEVGQVAPVEALPVRVEPAEVGRCEAGPVRPVGEPAVARATGEPARGMVEAVQVWRVDPEQQQRDDAEQRSEVSAEVGPAAVNAVDDRHQHQRVEEEDWWSVPLVREGFDEV